MTVRGTQDFTREQIAFAETYHDEAVDCPPNKLGLKEGQSAIDVGCLGWHDIGKPNPGGLISTCTDYHDRHSAWDALAPLLFPNLAPLGIPGIMGVVRSSTYLKEKPHFNEHKNT